MQTVHETRRQRLKMLIAERGSIAALNAALGWEATNARLSQIQNGSIRSGRGTKYEMGDQTARDIEERLSLPTGWMDTPPELDAVDDPSLKQFIALAAKLTPADRAKAARLLSALVEPPDHGPANGTTG